MKTGVYGDKDVAHALRALGKAPPAVVVDRAAREALGPMLQEARENTRAKRNYPGKYSSFFPQPKGKPPGGHADEGLVVRKVKSRGRSRRSFWLGGTKRAIKLLHLLEFGTAPHWQPNFKGGWLHPGARPSPVLAPAYEAHADGVVKRMGTALWRHLERQASTLSTRQRRGRR